MGLLLHGAWGSVLRCEALTFGAEVFEFPAALEEGPYSKDEPGEDGIGEVEEEGEGEEDVAEVIHGGGPWGNVKRGT